MENSKCEKNLVETFNKNSREKLSYYFNDDDDGNNKTLKCSDFSIDHILNRAGSSSSIDNSNIKLNNNQNILLLSKSLTETEAAATIISEYCSKEYDHHSPQNQISLGNNLLPMFDWLQYTRYKPPKLSRAFRSGPVKRTPGRLPRVPFTSTQLVALESAYRESTYLSSEQANKLAMQLDLTNTRVKIWFQNRRARERREGKDCSSNQRNIYPLEISPFNSEDNSS